MISENKFDDDKNIPIERRPWGYFCVLEEGDSYKVKKLVINPGHRLSLQLHRHRDEQWVVVNGKPTLRIGDEIRDYSVGESIRVKRGDLHRIENKNDIPAIIIEVQNGDYLGEDDIVRFEDDYSRINNIQEIN